MIERSGRNSRMAARHTAALQAPPRANSPKALFFLIASSKKQDQHEL
jgi:hypothetical protein